MKIRISNNIDLLKLNLWIPAVLALTLGLIAVQPVHAQRSETDQSRTMMDPTYNLKFMMGLAGEAEFEGEVDDSPLETTVDDDLEPTLGAGFEVDFPLHKYFLLGGMFSFLSWNTDAAEDADVDRSFLFDFSIVPKGRYPFEGSPVAIYLGMPIGFTLDSIDDESIEAVLPVGSVDIDLGYGMNLSVLAGVQVNLAQSFGLMLELGYTYHYFVHEGEVTTFGITVDGESEIEMEQFALNLGFYFM